MQVSCQNLETYCDLSNSRTPSPLERSSIPDACNASRLNSSLVCDRFSNPYELLSTNLKPLKRETCRDVSSKPPLCFPAKLDSMCDGFIDYDLRLAELPLATGTDEEALDFMIWCDISAFLLADNIGARELSRHLSLETANLMLLKWDEADHLTTSTSSGPSNGFSLILWPAANGFREDIVNRYVLFISSFYYCSILLQMISWDFICH